MFLHADGHVIVLNKPSGIPSVPLAGSSKPTAVALALEKYPELAQVGRHVGKPLEAGLLHRLDAGTSGVLAFARTPEDYERLKSLWKSTEILKTYRALVSGEPPFPKLPLKIELPIGRSAKSSKRMVIAREDRAHQLRGNPLPARTEVLQAKRIEFGACLRQLYDVEVTIRTGVMHQIRCHLSSQGWPILGDSLYKGDTSERLWLHAWKLRLPHDGGALEVEAPLPEGWPESA